MMNNTMMKKVYAATLIGVSAMLAAPLAVSAATITTYESSAKMETPDDNWHEVSDPETLITLTNGKDTVKVKKFGKKDAIPAPVTEFEKYEEIYQTYYSTANTIYMITGFAQTKEDIDDVRSVVESIKLADHQKEEAKKEEKTQAPATQTNNVMVLFADNVNTFYVYEYSDGTWRDADGIYYWIRSGSEWVNGTGNVFYVYSEVEPTMRTGEETKIYGQDGDAVFLRMLTDGTWRDNAGTIYWSTVEHEWVNARGGIFYDYQPDYVVGEAVTETREIYYLIGNGVTIFHYSNDEWRDSDGVAYVPNGDGTWSNSFGQTLYDDPDAIRSIREMEAAADAEVTAEDGTDEVKAASDWDYEYGYDCDWEAVCE